MWSGLPGTWGDLVAFGLSLFSPWPEAKTWVIWPLDARRNQTAHISFYYIPFIEVCHFPDTWHSALVAKMHTVSRMHWEQAVAAELGLSSFSETQRHRQFEIWKCLMETEHLFLWDGYSGGFVSLKGRMHTSSGRSGYLEWKCMCSLTQKGVEIQNKPFAKTQLSTPHFSLMSGSKVVPHTYSYACGSLFLGCPYSLELKRRVSQRKLLLYFVLKGQKMDLFPTEPDRTSTSLTLEGNTALKLHLATR